MDISKDASLLTLLDALNALQSVLGSERILNSAISRYAFANDAGPYLLIPQAIIQPQCEREIQDVFRIASEFHVPVVFRAGGTSLSGQSVTDGWLVDIGRYWREIKPVSSGAAVIVQPGAIGGLVNAHLKAYGRKIGPDPSSIMSAMMGGILSNNSSGMCCGVKLNAYHTMQSVRFILPDGSVWDTAESDAADRFEVDQQRIARGLAALRDRIPQSPKLLEKIRFKYQQKNTVGYSLNAFVDYQRPLDILAHLLVGAEGTLAFISQAVLKTVPDLPHKATALIYFADVLSACDSIPKLVSAGCAAIELMDRASLDSIRNLDGVPEELSWLLDEQASLMAILFEFHAEDDATLSENVNAFIQSVAPELSSLCEIQFTRDSKVQAKLWKLRKGMYPAVAAVRSRGEAAILEDIAVPLGSLGPAILDLQSLFRKHDYANGIIFGHAKDGNLHFVITQKLDGNRDVEKYARFIDDMVDLVVNRYNGALKAEHGTGRNMAPFVETEWGTEALEIMRELKDLIDPNGILNPDVILTKRSSLHLQDLKSLPVVEDVVDSCIECGACEPRCPSRDFTLTPRQRIVLRRSLKRLQQKDAPESDLQAAREIQRDYSFQGLATCATDGLCSIDCPVNINTGELVKELRQQKTGKLDRWLAAWLARHFGVAEIGVKLAIRAGMLFNSITFSRGTAFFTRLLGRVIPEFPQWRESLSTSTMPTAFVSLDQADYVYVPACMSRMMGGTGDALLRVCNRANVRICLPKNVLGSCCGQAFSSKGYRDAAVQKQSEFIQRAWAWSDAGRLPLVMDLGSCSAFILEGLPGLSTEDRSKLLKLQILDSIDFAADVLLPKLTVRKSLSVIALHSICANQKKSKQSHSSWEEKLKRIGDACSTNVIYPHEGKCCGMGGDRGFAVPELANASTATVAKTMQEASCDVGFTSARSCAIGLAASSATTWASIFHLLDECSR
ncbi:MAG: FAD-binding and (Fe-S)-binding domain-containing protein [Planctomycetota bacterium]|nr:FAD-binding and (Fe-S)-binding domain-containing protein [Planctomycetota bacterium]